MLADLCCAIGGRGENDMKVFLRIVLGLLGALALLIVAVLIGARFADGPIAIIAGGPFSTGELVTGPEPDWSFVHG